MTEPTTRPDGATYDRRLWEGWRRDACCDCTAPDPADCARYCTPSPKQTRECPCHYLSHRGAAAMTDPTITDLRRELEKAHAALDAARTHLARHAEMNAALHCADRVMYSPLHARVGSAITGIEHALNRTKPAVTVTEWAAEHSDRHCPWRTLLADLDRCQHGRHEGDACGPAGDCNGTSAGNLWLQPGMVIGHGLRGDEIVVPGRDEKHDPANWRRKGGR